MNADQPVPEDYRVPPVLKELTVHRVPPVSEAQQEPRDYVVFKGPLVSRVLKALRVFRVQLVRLDL